MINAGRVQKRKIIQDFEDDLVIKGILDRKKYEDNFRRILDRVYKHSWHDIKPNITRFKTLSVLMVKEHTYIYLEIYEDRNYEVLLSVTRFDDFENNKTCFTSLEEALRIIDNVCRRKV